VQTGVILRRFGGTTALVAAVGGLVGLAAACAPAVPTATLDNRTVTVTGTDNRDVISITVDANQLVVDFGFDGEIDAQFRRSDFDRLQVQGNGGNDGMSVSGAGEVPAVVNGGPGNDNLSTIGPIGETAEDAERTTLNGEDGNDGLFAASPTPVTMVGGPGDDRADGDGGLAGTQTVDLGEGNDRFKSSMNAAVGARIDIVDGGPGRDRMDIEGTFETEGVGLSSEAGKLVVRHQFRDRIDADNIEDVSWLGFGGLSEEGSGDAVAVNDLSGTDVLNVTPNFSADQSNTEPNNSSDTLTFRGTPGVDRITISSSGGNITISGVGPETVTPIHLRADDFLLIQTLDGNDVVDSSGLEPGLVQLIVQ
jgi:hypothetical protein